MPGWVLLPMLRRAAPLRRAWSAALATLASVAFGAAATQFHLSIDDPAHQLVGHVLPVALLGLGGDRGSPMVELAEPRLTSLAMERRTAADPGAWRCIPAGCHAGLERRLTRPASRRRPQARRG